MEQINLVCSCCGKTYTFPRFRHEYNKKRGCKKPVCSIKCRSKQISINNLKIGMTKSGSHLRFSFGSNKGKYVHRVIMEKYIKRKLLPYEIVHHINGDPLDNRIENLLVCVSVSEHMKYHTSKGKQGFQRIKNV